MFKNPTYKSIKNEIDRNQKVEKKEKLKVQRTKVVHERFELSYVVSFIPSKRNRDKW